MEINISNANFTGGSLLIRESRIVAKLLAERYSKDEVLGQVLSRNLFQNNSKATTQKYCQLVLARLGNLTDEQLRFVTSDSCDLARLTLLVAALKTYPIISDFMKNVVAEKVRCFEPRLEKSDWMHFLEDRAKRDPSVKGWSEKSQRKMGQTVIRMLAEAGFLDGSGTMTILFPSIPTELAQSLQGTCNDRLLACIKLRR